MSGSRKGMRRYGIVYALAAASIVAVPAAYADQGGNGGDKGKQGSGTADEGDNRHPSGKDRSVESGGSGTQGKSQSDPDGDSNGGMDKPGGSGGVDRADQDGNNGCGNDDDFEDDNRGNCLGRQGAPGQGGAEVRGRGAGRGDCDGDMAGSAGCAPCAEGEHMSGTGDCVPDVLAGGFGGLGHGHGVGGAGKGNGVGADVLGTGVAGTVTAANQAVAARAGAEVLGVTFSRTADGRVAVTGQTLPVTGSELVAMLVAGLSAVGTGAGVLAASSRRR